MLLCTGVQPVDTQTFLGVLGSSNSSMGVNCSLVHILWNVVLKKQSNGPLVFSYIEKIHRGAGTDTIIFVILIGKKQGHIYGGRGLGETRPSLAWPPTGK